MNESESPDIDRQSGEQPAEPVSQRTFSLASLLLFMTLVAFLLEMAKWDLGVGVAIVVLSVPALIRTARIARRMKTRGKILPFREKLFAFCYSLALVGLIAVATGGTFLAITYPCATAGGLDIGAMSIVAALALGVSGSIGVTLIRRFWLPKE